MAKQLTKEEWLYYFDLYERNKKQFLIEYSNRIEKKIWKLREAKRWFLKKYKNYKYHNNVMMLESKTGKSPKKGKSSGRPVNKEKRRQIISEFEDELKDELIEDLLEIINNSDDKKHKEILKKIIKKSKLSSRRLSFCLNYSKSYICNIRNGFEYKKEYKTSEIDRLIISIFNKSKGRLGRKPIAAILAKNGFILSDRQVGRKMKKLNLFCEIRKKRKQKENKNINVKLPNIANRDYDNVSTSKTILATDVTYITAPKDVNQNHVYLSVSISNKTKEIISYKLSIFNDTKLAVDTIKNINLEDLIHHSDHGSIYSTSEFVELINEKKWTQSMSRIGNCLDNRVVEYWFSIFKSEYINRISVKNITFDELSKLIDDYIHYYNKERIQEKLNWLTPYEYNKNIKNGFVHF